MLLNMKAHTFVKALSKFVFIKNKDCKVPEFPTGKTNGRLAFSLVCTPFFEKFL